ncbi:unnamed protein product [Staurois parvus]|uniref:Uncharacterized protein n=1 Tax=Staurois parvus TaxID=386267 RepID=A0ABN9H975_9NEOB|nr:unnamed protein product [Staurois parvus]
MILPTDTNDGALFLPLTNDGALFLPLTNDGALFLTPSLVSWEE